MTERQLSYTETSRLFQKSFFGAQRPVTVIFLVITVAIFSLGVILGFSWQIGWLVLATALFLELVQSAYDLNRRFFLFDAPLFCLGILVFAVVDPVFAILAGQDFPSVGGSAYPQNEIGNMTGLVISSFCASFFLGRLLVAGSSAKSFQGTLGVLPLPKATRPSILILASLLALSAYLASGGGFSIANLMYTIAARSKGYVAFASSGLGTENPLIVLLAQSMPTAIVLWLISIKRSRPLWNLVAISIAVFFLTLFILSGGRSGFLLVTLTCVIFVLVQYDFKLRIMRTVILALLSMLVLGFQSNFRDTGRFSQDFIQHSPFRGFALNREVAFIVSEFSESSDFIRGPGFVARLVLPIPETIFLFLTNPVPRIIWKNKPISPSFAEFNELRTGASGFGATSNVTPTIPGRFYMVYGFPGVLQIGLLLGFLWRYFDSRLLYWFGKNSANVLTFAMLNAVLFISVRDLTPGKFYPVLFLLFFIWLSRLRIRWAASAIFH